MGQLPKQAKIRIGILKLRKNKENFENQITGYIFLASYSKLAREPSLIPRNNGHYESQIPFFILCNSFDYNHSA